MLHMRRAADAGKKEESNGKGMAVRDKSDDEAVRQT